MGWEDGIIRKVGRKRWRRINRSGRRNNQEGWKEEMEKNKWVGKDGRIRKVGRKRRRWKKMGWKERKNYEYWKEERERKKSGKKDEAGRWGGGGKEKKNVGKKKIFKKNDRMKGCMYEKNERGSRIDKKKYFLQAPSPSYSLILQIPGGG